MKKSNFTNIFVIAPLAAALLIAVVTLVTTYWILASQLEQSQIDQLALTAASATSLVENKIILLSQTLERVAKDGAMEKYSKSYNSLPLQAHFSNYSSHFDALSYVNSEHIGEFHVIRGTANSESRHFGDSDAVIIAAKISNKTAVDKPYRSPWLDDYVIDLGFRNVNYFDEEFGIVRAEILLKTLSKPLLEADALRDNIVMVTNSNGDVVLSNTERYIGANTTQWTSGAAKRKNAGGGFQGRVQIPSGDSFAYTTTFSALNWRISVFSPSYAFLSATRKLNQTIAIAAALLLGSFGTVQFLRIKTRRMEQKRYLAEASSKMKSEFLAKMSHELRTPLNAVIGYSELLGEELAGTIPSHYLGDLNKIKDSGEHLLNLVNQILDISKIEAGQMQIRPETFVVTDIVNAITDTLAPSIRKNRNKLNVITQKDLGTMQNDATKIRQILLNLLSNANKFTENGVITLTTQRERNEDGESVRFIVEDTGIGIAKDKIDGLFDEFTQIDSSLSRKHLGTGLGLAITKRFCELMQGEISIKSAVGRGTTVTIRLPAQIPQK